MKWKGVAYRAHDPNWAWQPISGAGAAAKGGRFNPLGVPALYLASTLEGTFLEQGHGFGHRFEPLTVCSYDVDVVGLVDLRRDAGRVRAGVRLDELNCAWALDVASGREPVSWMAARRLISNDASGILVPSFARGARPEMFNVVLWQWGKKLPHKVIVHDPSGKLRGLKAPRRKT